MNSLSRALTHTASSFQKTCPTRIQKREQQQQVFVWVKSPGLTHRSEGLTEIEGTDSGGISRSPLRIREYGSDV